MDDILITEPFTRLEILLETWADWMRRGNSVARGYPNKAAGITEQGAQSIEDIEWTGDTWAAKAMDAIIQGLPQPEQGAINHRFLHSRYTFHTFSYPETLQNALALIEKAADKKGIV